MDESEKLTMPKAMAQRRTAKLADTFDVAVRASDTEVPLLLQLMAKVRRGKPAC